MILALLLFSAAFVLAGVAGFFSVAGLVVTYGGVFWPIVAIGSSIEVGKLVGVSFTYRYWEVIPLWMKTSLITLLTAVMVVTSFGVFGYLTKANQVDIAGLKQTVATQKLLQEEQDRLLARKQQIDKQISELPTNSVSSRIRLQGSFKTELAEINTRLPAIEREKATLATTEIEQQSDLGPLIFIAETFGYDINVATTWFTLLLVLVLDPLAVLLTICGNFVLARIKQTPAKVEPSEKDEVPIPPPPAPLPIEPTVVPEPAPVEPVVVVEPTVVPDSPLVASTPSSTELLLKSDFTHFVNKNLSNARGPAFEEKLGELKRFVTELDARGSDLSVDEVILKDRITNFLKTHDTSLGNKVRAE
jgi:hypothetical protein